jgi:HD-GYP domain-containing protein (c-di-GMP phosphodiesterase class II)
MLRVRVEQIRPNMRLARPVPLPSNPARYLLQRDVALTDDMRRRLLEIGVQEVWIRCEELQFLEGLIDPELGERQRELYGNIRRNFERFMHFTDARLDFNAFKGSLTNLFSYLRNQGGVGIRFLDKVQIFDDYLLTHSTNVAYLSMLLGMKLDWYLIDQRRSLPPSRAKEVIDLALGCLLHDVGKMRTDRAILDKPGRLSPDEMTAIKKHPALGYEMVKDHIPLSAAQVVLHHHQRWDGRGYPAVPRADGTSELSTLAGTKIHVFARIASICDVFDAATSKRVYSDAKPSVQVLSEMLRYNEGAFDPVVRQAFYEIVPPFPIGTLVTLSNDFKAGVVDFDSRHPCAPRVKPLYYPEGDPCRFPDNREIDLATVKDLSIVSVGDVDVRPYLFDAVPKEEPNGVPVLR